MTLITVTPSDVVLLSIINAMSEINLSLSETLCVSYFLADNIDLSSGCKQFTALTEMLETLKPNLCASSFSYFSNAMCMKNIDSCIEMFESLASAHKRVSEPNCASNPQVFSKNCIIGVYVRTRCVLWNKLPFSSVCRIFDDVCKFSCPGSKSGVIVSHSRDDVKVEELVQHQDSFGAIKTIHNHFDDRSALSRHSQLNHQEAMLSLSTMWIRNDQFSQAFIAAEEGMRMAHQLGDHDSVARALLLLHHIVDSLPQASHADAHGKLSAECVLIRCMQRCRDLKLSYLAAETVLLLVRLRSKSGFQDVPYKSSLCGDITSRAELLSCNVAEKEYRPSYSHYCVQLRPQTLWCLFLTALNSEENLFCQQQFNKFDLQYCMNLCGHSGIVASEVWARLGVNYMALVSCKRAIRQSGMFQSRCVIGYMCSLFSDMVAKTLPNGSMLTSSHVLLLLRDIDTLKSYTNDTNGIGGYLENCLLAIKVLQASNKIATKEFSKRIWKLIESCLHLVELRRLMFSVGNSSQLLQLSHALVHELSEGNSKPFMLHQAISLRCLILTLFGDDYCATKLKSTYSSCELLACDLKLLQAQCHYMNDPKNSAAYLPDLYASLQLSRGLYAPQCDASLSVLICHINGSSNY